MNQIEKFYAYLQELEENYTKLSHLLQDKMTAVLNFDVVKLDAIIKEEQVYVLLSKGFDTNLLDYRESLNLKGKTLGEAIDELPVEHRGAFRELHGRLSATLDEVQSINQKCQSMIEDRLYALDRSIKSLDKSESTTYRGENGQRGGLGAPEVKASLFTKSI